MSKCDKCAHKDVCRYKNEYAELEGKLPTTQPPFSSSITCGQYQEMKPTPRGLYDLACQQTASRPFYGYNRDES